MNCSDVNEMLAEYWDLTDHDPRKIELDQHITHCSDCEEQFQLWEESSRLIQTSSPPLSGINMPERLSKRVMNQIYDDESWRVPVPNRIYSISYKIRRNLTAVISFCLTLFTISFLYSIFNKSSEPVYSFEGLMPVASAMADSNKETNIFSATFQGVPVASISEPFILGMNPIKSYPDYMVALSLLGIVIALLIMNWFSRIRA